MEDAIDFTRCFAVDYAGACAKLRAAAETAGASLASYRHPAASAP
jgi:hypothetical protein